MSADQQFILALITLVGAAVASILAAWQSRETHKAVNGIASRNVRRAHAKGVTAGRRREQAVDPPPVDAAPTPGV